MNFANTITYTNQIYKTHYIDILTRLPILIVGLSLLFLLLRSPLPAAAITNAISPSAPITNPLSPP
ncbi:MAG TPA: hypothetical protein VLL52_17250, partial [Anaerolineae bacterium]|nr:hypothetical protein [Anaerolineae bacterium]